MVLNNTDHNSEGALVNDSITKGTWHLLNIAFLLLFVLLSIMCFSYFLQMFLPFIISTRGLNRGVLNVVALIHAFKSQNIFRVRDLKFLLSWPTVLVVLVHLWAPFF